MQNGRLLWKLCFDKIFRPQYKISLISLMNTDFFSGLISEIRVTCERQTRAEVRLAK